VGTFHGELGFYGPGLYAHTRQYDLVPESSMAPYFDVILDHHRQHWISDHAPNHHMGHFEICSQGEWNLGGAKVSARPSTSMLYFVVSIQGNMGAVLDSGCLERS